MSDNVGKTLAAGEEDSMTNDLKSIMTKCRLSIRRFRLSVAVDI